MSKLRACIEPRHVVVIVACHARQQDGVFASLLKKWVVMQPLRKVAASHMKLHEQSFKLSGFLSECLFCGPCLLGPHLPLISDNSIHVAKRDPLDRMPSLLAVQS